MDRLIARFDSIADGDLRICDARGVAYQRDMRRARVSYGADYLAKVQAYEGSEIAARVNAGRCALLARHLPAGSLVLDYGAGSGAFMREARAAGFEMSGFELIPESALWLRESGAWGDNPENFEATTMWDVIEHLEAPENVLKRVKRGDWLFVSVPVFEDLRAVRGSKHYRPGEHLYYWTPEGFVDYMGLYGFRLVERSDHETRAGRESIGAFAFRRDLPDYQDHVAAYAQMHAERYYGSSATELHLELVAKVVRTLNPSSILDYGAGRSDLVAHFYRDGKRKLARYDPAIPTMKALPDGPFDLCLCCDVLEHVPMAGVDLVLRQIRERAAKVLFTISTKLARAKLPDGRNAHVTLLSTDEWRRWVDEYFGAAQLLPSKWEHEVIILAGHSHSVAL